MNTCRVLNNALAWDWKGNYDEAECPDLDPLELYRTCPDVEKPAELFAALDSRVAKGRPRSGFFGASPCFSMRTEGDGTSGTRLK